ncbi:MAG: aspartate carbamoyltransferase catalytic subunit [Acidimicrobiia bacterium]
MKHLLSARDLSAQEIDELMHLSDSFVEVSSRPIAKVPALRSRTVAWLFYEDSTRTRLSFETAAKRLSADTLNFSVSSSSVNKGESLKDTALTLSAMGVDAIVVRHRSSGVPWQLTRWVDCSIINAGDGWHEHPTQTLLDIYTMRHHFGEGGLAGKKLTLVGDIKHSRVAGSMIFALAKMGMEVTMVAPPTLLPPAVDTWPATVRHNLEPELADTDVLYLLRMQNERQNQALVPSLREYSRLFGVNIARAQMLSPHALIMHPGPMNRGVEIDGEVADLPNAVMVDQVRNGVAVRMAVLFKLLQGTGGTGTNG